MKRFYKFTNTFVTVNFDNNTVDLVNKNDHKGLQVIHVFVYDPDQVKEKSLRVIGAACRRRHIQLIVHCCNKSVLREMRKKLKRVEKDKWFHLSLMKGNAVVFKPSPYQSISFNNEGAVTDIYEDGKMQSRTYRNFRVKKYRTLEANDAAG